MSVLPPGLAFFADCVSLISEMVITIGFSHWILQDFRAWLREKRKEKKSLLAEKARVVKAYPLKSKKPDSGLDELLKRFNKKDI